MTEDFLHYIWRFQALKPGPWKGTQGEVFKVIHPGYPNFDSGPDFQEARISIDGQIWVGSVEIHISSKDWYQHKHQFDPAYNNVVLHVVYDSNVEVVNAQGNLIPELKLASLFDEQLYWRFEQKLNKSAKLACESSFPTSDRLHKQQMLDRCASLRLEERSTYIQKIYEELHGDWDGLVYRLVARALGLKVNSEPMEMLARVLPFSLWQKYLDRPQQRMALFLGMSGILPSKGDAEVTKWAQEFQYLAHKHQLQAMDGSMWKYARMRPVSFPDRRIAQLASIAPEILKWFRLIRNGKWSEINWPSLDSYWTYHYRLNKVSARKLSAKWSEDRINILKINALIPVLFFYARKVGNYNLQEKALALLEEIPPEDNSISRSYEQLGLTIGSAYDSQACITWYEYYCRPKKCLTCTLGNELLNT